MARSAVLLSELLSEHPELTPYKFVANREPSLGVELELNLVDSQTMALRSGVTQILGGFPADLEGSVKPELFQCYIELNTKVCHDVAEADQDLTRKSRWSATSRPTACASFGGDAPFSPWQDQEVTQDDRYFNLIDFLQETARRLMTFGLHVHVGVDSGDKAIMICDRILQHLPTLLALSVNSPFWQGRNTGLHSQRSKIMETLPTAGLPPLMRTGRNIPGS